MVADTPFHQFFEIFVFHGGGHALFVIHLFVDVIFRLVSSLGDKDVQFVLTVKVIAYFYPNTEANQGSQRTVRHGGREGHTNGEGRVTVKGGNKWE